MAAESDGSASEAGRGPFQFRLRTILLVFVIVALAITSLQLTYRYRRLSLECKQSQERASAERRRAEETMHAARQLQQEANTLKSLMGFPVTTEIDDVRDQFDRDMETFGADVPLEQRCYRRVLARMHDELEQRRAGDPAN